MMARADDIRTEINRRADVKAEMQRRSISPQLLQGVNGISRDVPTQPTQDVSREPPIQNLDTEQPATVAQLGVFDRLSESTSKRAANLAGTVGDLVSPESLIPGVAQANLLKATTGVGGFLGGVVADVAGEVMGGALNVAKKGAPLALAITPDFVKNTLLNTIEGISESGAAEKAIEITKAYQGFSEQNPEASQFLEDTLNSAGLFGAGAGGKAVAKGALTQSARKQTVAQKILEGIKDADTATVRITPRTRIQQALGVPQKITPDVAATKAIQQGFEPGVIAAIKGASSSDKKAMRKMVETLTKTRQNAAFGLINRPADEAGKTLLKRFTVIKNTNAKAGKLLDRVANSLKGKKVNTQEPVRQFVDDLDRLGVSIGRNGKPDFTGSDIEGIAGAERIITSIVKRMASRKNPDAFEAHRLKRFIDEQVTFGKSVEGLSGQTVNTLKNLRRNLDTKLDKTFPRYNKVNTAYSETITAIDNFQDVVGRKLNLTGKNADKAVGTILRRVMSNAQSRVKLVDSIDDIEAVAKKFGGKFDDDLLVQTLFADELDTVFKPAARTGFKSQVAQGIERGATATATGGLSSIAKGAQAAADVVAGVNPENAIIAIQRVLKEQK